jgi:flavin reductase (DIM6/NTAB) family NADH-FMN oxidoreductase RutF
VQPVDVLSWFWAPISAVGSHGPGGPNAQLTVSVFGASSVPERPRLLVVLYRPNYTRELVEASGTLAISVLDRSQMALVEPLGIQSGRQGDKLGGIEVELTGDGDPWFPGGVGIARCEVIEAFELGEATAFLCAVRERRALAGEETFTTADIRGELGDAFTRPWEEKRARDLPMLRELMHWREE